MKYTTALRREYEELFATATIRPAHLGEVDHAVFLITRPLAWSRYQAVAEQTRVPAHVIGIIHYRESSGNFGTHLHNGDPLDERTVHVPAGRPVTGHPPFSWEASAVDALSMPGQALDRWEDWSIGGMCFVFERYNGFGYRNRGVNSPYLWGYTTAYERGLYVADGKWSATAVNKNPGAMALLRRMIDRGFGGAHPPSAEPASAEPAIVIPSCRDMQQALRDLGLYRNKRGGLGKVDGDWGSQSQAALAAYYR